MEQMLTARLEIKQLSKGQFEGYGSVFNNIDRGGDVVVPGAFKKSLAEHKQKGELPLMFWMHKMDQVPGKWLAMEEDTQGLYVKGELADTQLGRETHTLLEMKAVRGLSIGYITQDYSYDSEGNRLLKSVDLLETSIVSLAMNPLADITSVKTRLSNMGEYVPTPEDIALLKRDAEHFLQKKGFNRQLAVLCAGNLLRGIGEEASLEPKNDEEASSESQIKTPDEIEVLAGLSNFQERMILQDLEKAFKKYF